MEEKIIDKLRKQKKILKRVKKYVKGYIDLESEIMDYETIYIKFNIKTRRWNNRYNIYINGK